MAAAVTDTRKMVVTMPDGSQWAVPVRAIIENRLAFYRGMGKAERADESPDDVEIHDWAENNMDWDDVASVAVKVKDREPLSPRELQEGWCNGAKDIVAGER